MAPEGNEKVPWPAAVVWAVRLAIAAVGLYDLYWFVDYLPSFSGPGGSLINWLDFASVYIAAPLCGLTGLALAAQGRQLKLAAIIVAIPQIYWTLSIVAFVIGIMIYGF